jgi:hypothetical protein
LRDSQLLQSFIDYLKCGRVKQRKGKESVEYIVTRLSDIADKIIPLFEKYLIYGEKVKDYEDFKKVAIILQKKGQLTKEGLEEI